MEADWEVEIGGAAPVIDACWPGFVDLRFHPRVPPDAYLTRARELMESANLPNLPEALVRLNGLNSSRSPIWTSKCDVWPVLDPANLDAVELDAPQQDATFGWACYIDLLPLHGSWPAPAVEKPGSWAAEDPGSWVRRRFISGVEATESTPPLHAAENPLEQGFVKESFVREGFVKGHDFSRADKANERNGALEGAEKLASDGFVTGHDFSRADETDEINGASAPEATSKENSRGIPSSHAAQLADAAVHACKAWCQQLHAIPLTHCRADLIVRQAIIAPDQTNLTGSLAYGITAYLTACGRTSKEANATLARALQTFANTLCPDSTVE